MLRRPAAPLATLLVLLLTLAVAGPGLAKEGMQARLDAPIPADTPPGTTIEVGWTTFVPDGQGGEAVAFSGAPVYLALRSPGATEPEAVVFGDESPAGSGHFTASIRVPEGGIAPDGVSIGLRGESCVDGVCTRSDLPFELVGPVLATGPADVAPAAASPMPVPVLATTPDPAAESAPGTTPWLAVGAILLLGGLLLGIRRGRRRAAIVATGTLVAVVVTLMAAGGALAKEDGVLVTFDPPIPDDPAPATTLDLSWSMVIEPIDGSAATTPYEATPLILRVTSRSGVPVDVPATHLGRGRYTAAVTVPETGLGALDLGLPTETGALLLLAEVFDAPPRIRTVGPGPTTTDADPMAGTLPIVGMTLGVALVVGLAVVVVGRRRRRPPTIITLATD